MTRAALTFIAVSLARVALAGDLSWQIDASAAQDTVGESESNYLRQAYWLSYRQDPVPPLSYGLSLRYQDDRGRNITPTLSNDLRSGTLTPTAEFQYRMESVGVGVRYELTHTEQRAQDETRLTLSRDIQRLAVQSYAKPFKDAEARLYADRTGYSDRRANVRSDDDRAGLTLKYSRGRFHVSEETRVARLTDRAADVTRTSYGPRLSTTYSQPLGSRFLVTGRYAFDYERSEQEAFGGSAAVIPFELQPAFALYVQLALPLDTSATPMQVNPALVDRELGTSTGISLGPDGDSFHNLGVDMGRVVQLDRFRIHVRNASGEAIPTSAPIAWSAYASDDGIRWGLIDGTSSTFSAATSSYDVVFTAATGRYFKVVNFGVNTIETFATELQVFESRTARPRETLVSSTLLHAFGLSASARLPKLVLTYAGQANLYSLNPSQSASQETNDLNNSAVGTVGPFGPFTLQLAQSWMQAHHSAGGDQYTSRTTAGIRYQPVLRYEARLEGTRSYSEISTVQSLSTGANLSSSAQLLEALSVSAMGGITRQQIAGGGDTRSVIGTSMVNARLYRWLTLNGSAAMQRVRSEGDISAQRVSPLLRVVAYERYSMEAAVKPNDSFGVYVLGGYTSSDAGSGVLQNYRADWSPFRGGTLQLSLDYAQDIDPFTGDSIQRFTASPRWAINRNCSLQFYYATLRGEAGDAPIDATNLFLSFRAYMQ